jgi:hypothetical protein
MYRYIKMAAIGNENIALVEYIKNCYDSYVRLTNGNLAAVNATIKIGVNVKERYIYSIDNAEGMSAKNMFDSFSQVGSHTGGDNNSVNALFSKGATDTTALGELTYVAILDNKLSSCTVSHTDVFYSNISDRPVTAEERLKYSIPKNGTYLQLDLLSTYTMKSYEYVRSVHKYFSLITIMNNPYVDVLFNYVDISGNVIDKDTKLVLDPIETNNVLVKDQIIEIPGWFRDNGDPVQSTFDLFLAKDTIDDVTTADHYKRSGVFIEYNGVTVDRTHFNRSIESIPVSNRIFGTLKCDFIFELLRRYDSADNTDPKNMLPLIEPNRLTGINRQHPFVSDLFKVPQAQLKYILEDLDGKDNSFDSSSTLKISDLFGMIGEWHSAILYEMRDFIYMFQKTDRTSTFNKIVTLKASSVVSEATSEYSNNMPPEIERADEGNMDPVFPTINLTFVHESYKLPYVIYNINNRIQVNLNVSDYLLSKCVKYNELEKKFTITNINELGMNIVHYLTEALAREIFKSMDSKLNTAETVQRNTNEGFAKLCSFRPSLHMAIYTTLITKNKILELISNEEPIQ